MVLRAFLACILLATTASAIAQQQPPRLKDLLIPLDRAIADEKAASQNEDLKRALRPIFGWNEVQDREQALFARLEKIPQTAEPFVNSPRGLVVDFLGRMKYQPAVPYFSARLLALAPEGDVNRGEGVVLINALARAFGESTPVPAIAQRWDRMTSIPYRASMQQEMAALFTHLERSGTRFSNSSLAALLRDKPGDDVFAVLLTRTLVRREEREAIDIVLTRLEALAQQNPRSTADLITSLAAFTELKDPSLLDYARLRRAFPPQMSASAANVHLDFVRRREEPQAAADIPFYYLGLPNLSVKTVDLMLMSDSPAQWRDAREYLDGLRRENKMDAGMHRMLSEQLREAIAEPQRHIGHTRRLAQAREFAKEEPRLNELGMEAERALGWPWFPAKMEAYMAEAERLEAKYPGINGGWVRVKLRQGYDMLATQARFDQKDPKRAIAFYDKAARHSGRHDFLLDVLAGDVYQFDLRDPAKAVQRYESAAAALRAADTSGVIDNYHKQRRDWWNGWLGHEIAFLRTGKTFSGQLAESEAIAIFYATTYLTDVTKLPQPENAEALERMQASRLTLVNTAGLISTLAEGDILRNLEKHDPSGYWSACILGAVPRLDTMKRQPGPPHPEMLPGLWRLGGIRTASARFLAERKIVLKPE